MTTPSESGPAQYGYNWPETGELEPLGRKIVAAFPRESWLIDSRAYCSVVSA
jgi:hypothetical protein